MANLDGQWNATAFFERLCAKNRLAVANKFFFGSVSGLDGFEDALSAMKRNTAFCLISDTADGFTELHNTPHTRRVKTVFLAMRHKVDDMASRNECLETMRELFRQFMSALIPERTLVEEKGIYLDPRITFSEIDSYFFSGCACAYFNIAVDVYMDLSYNADEWF